MREDPQSVGQDRCRRSSDLTWAMLLPHPFRRFLANIRPDRRQLEALQRAHLDLSRRLRQDADTRGILVSTFLQGSYRRSTAIRGSGSSGASDVDLVMVTNIDPRAHGPERALRLLEPFLRRNYANWRPQGRSSGITVGGAELDLVLASAPSRVNLLAAEAGAEPLDAGGSPTPAELLAWKSEPLLIPDRKLRRWVPTHPLAQLARTRDKNARCNTHYLGVVKAIKWWRSCNAEMPEHPRSYPLERLIEECCPDGIESVDEGVVRTLEGIARRYRSGQRPRLSGHGVLGQDVLARVPQADFLAFVEMARDAAEVARRALDGEDAQESAAEWQRLFGDAFPSPAVRGEEDGAGLLGRSRSVDELLAEIRERGSVLVSGLEELQRLKRALEQAVRELGIYIVWDPSTPAELRDYVGAMALSTAQYGIAGAAGGLLIGALLKDSRRWMTLGAVFGGIYGAIRGHSQVREGWRVRSWYEGEQVVCVEVLGLPIGRLK